MAVQAAPALLLSPSCSPERCVRSNTWLSSPSSLPRRPPLNMFKSQAIWCIRTLLIISSHLFWESACQSQPAGPVTARSFEPLCFVNRPITNSAGFLLAVTSVFWIRADDAFVTVLPILIHHICSGSVAMVPVCGVKSRGRLGNTNWEKRDTVTPSKWQTNLSAVCSAVIQWPGGFLHISSLKLGQKREQNNPRSPDLQ